MNAKGLQLAQAQVAASIAAIFTAQAPVEITAVWICNTSGAARTVRLCHDDDGTTYTAATALLWDKQIPANDYLFLSADELNGGIAMRQGGSIAAETDSANGLTITLYGVTADQTSPLGRMR